MAPPERITTSGPIEVDRGYYEYRVNWDGAALLQMSGEQLERFKAAIDTLDDLASVEQVERFRAAVDRLAPDNPQLDTPVSPG